MYIPSLHEIWGDCALFVHPEDTFGLAKCVNYLTTDEQHRETMASKAMARSSEFTCERIVTLYMDVYDTLTN